MNAKNWILLGGLLVMISPANLLSQELPPLKSSNPGYIDISVLERKIAANTERIADLDERVSTLEEQKTPQVELSDSGSTETIAQGVQALPLMSPIVTTSCWDCQVSNPLPNLIQPSLQVQPIVQSLPATFLAGPPVGRTWQRQTTVNVVRGSSARRPFLGRSRLRSCRIVNGRRICN